MIICINRLHVDYEELKQSAEDKRFMRYNLRMRSPFLCLLPSHLPSTSSSVALRFESILSLSTPISRNAYVSYF